MFFGPFLSSDIISTETKTLTKPRTQADMDKFFAIIPCLTEKIALVLVN